MKHWLRLGVLLSGAYLSACTQIDDFMLGKDNTPKPTPLKPLHTTAKLTQRWSTFIGKNQAGHDYLKLRPTVHDGLIYAATTKGQVAALTQAHGHIRWTKTYPYSWASGPVVGRGNLALTSTNANLVLLNASNGEERWHTSLSSPSIASPIITETDVIVKTIDGNLYAFDLQNGKKRWGSTHGAPHLILKANASPVLYNDMIIVGYSDGKIEALDAKTGHIHWERSINTFMGAADIDRLVDIDADPLIQNQVLYLAGYHGDVSALSLENGNYLWKHPASIYQDMSIIENNLYYTDSDSIVSALNTINGHLLWTQTALKSRRLTNPVILGSYLFVGDHEGYLHVLSRQNGSLVARETLPAAIEVSPVVAHHTIFVLAANGQLSAYQVS